MIYLDDIIIYSDSEEEHEKHIKQVLEKLHNENIPIAIEKCEFHTRKTDFVEFIIEPEQISIDLKKIKAIIKWKDLKSIIGLRSFLGFCNYYRKFITKQSDEMEPFTKMTKKNKLQNWDNQKKKLFKEIKNKFTKKPILKIYQPELLTRVETDVLDFVLETCLLQKHDKIWHPVIYYS